MVRYTLLLVGKFYVLENIQYTILDNWKGLLTSCPLVNESGLTDTHLSPKVG